MEVSPGMEVSPKTFREVEFRERKGGYHPEDVDQFLEQMAAGVEVLLERLRQAVERAQRAERAASEAGGNDETLRRTLVLAQRTADLAVQEANEQATRIVSGAEAQARSLIADAETRARRMHDEALSDVQAELAELESVRARAQQEVDALARWADEHRSHLTTTLQDALSMLERASLLSPPPSSAPLELPGARPVPGVEPPRAAVATPPPPEPEPESRAEARSPGAFHGGDREPGRTSSAYAEPTEVVRSSPERGPAAATEAYDFSGESEDDAALGSFFDDGGLGDDRRLGGRLRRRR